MAETLEAPTTEETQVSKAGIASWMKQLSTDLPNPSLGGGQPNETTQANPDNGKAGEVEKGPGADGVVQPTTPAIPQPVHASPAGAKPDAEAEAKWPRSAKEWKNHLTAHNAKLEEFQKQIVERENKIKELQEKTSQTLTPEIQKKIETLEKENGQYSERLRILDITNHPKFRNYFDTKINNALGQLKTIVKADQLDEVSRLIQLPDSEDKNNRMNDLLLTMTPLQQGRFLGVVNQLTGTQSEMQAEVARAKENYEAMMQNAKHDREQNQAKFSKMLDDSIKAAQDPKSGRPEYQMRDGEAEWNSAVLKRIESAKQLIQGNLSPEVMFKAAFDAAAHADVLAWSRSLLADNEKLKKQISAMTAANPKVETGQRTPVPGATPENAPMPKDSRPMDYTKKWVQSFGKALQGEQG